MAGDSGGVSTEERQLQELILDANLERLEDMLAEFNLFDVLRIERAELQHSAFLAWLLDPRGSHRLGDYFLRRFITQAALEAQKLDFNNQFSIPSPFVVDGWGLNDIEVFTERQAGSGRRRIDILLVGRDDEFACVIENKIGAGEGVDQLKEYLNSVEDEYQGFTIFPIFLTPEGRKPQDEEDARHYIPLGYKLIDRLIERVLDRRKSTVSESAKTFLEQYKQSLGRSVLNTSDNNIEELALQIYDKHTDAIERIIRTKNTRDDSEQTQVWGIIESAIETTDLQFPGPAKPYRGLLSPGLNDVSAEMDIPVYFDVMYRFQQVRIRLMVGPGPQEKRERLRQLAQTHSTFSVGKKFGAKWGEIYQKRILDKGDFSPLVPEAAKPKVKQSIKDFYDNDYYPLVNAIRAEFDVPPVPHP